MVWKWGKLPKTGKLVYIGQFTSGCSSWSLLFLEKVFGSVPYRDGSIRFSKKSACGLGSVVVCPGVAGGTGMLLKVDYHVLECVRSMLESSFGV